VGPALRDQAVEQRLEVADPTGLVLHRGHGHRRAGGEHDGQASLDLGGLHHAPHAGCDVHDVSVAGRVHPQQAAADGHGWPTKRMRANLRLPSWITLPSIASGSMSRVASGSAWPSSLTPPWASERRASELEI